jgi:hypothetical protein
MSHGKIKRTDALFNIEYLLSSNLQSMDIPTHYITEFLALSKIISKVVSG